MLTCETDKNEEYCTNGPGGDAIGTGEGSEILCEGGEADANERSKNVEARELELLGEVLLDRENELLECEDKERILAAETREGANCDDDRA